MSNTKDLNYNLYLQTKQPITLTGIPNYIFDTSATSVTLGGTNDTDNKLSFNYTTITENIQLETDLSSGIIDISHGVYFLHDLISDISNQIKTIHPTSSVKEKDNNIEFNDISNNVNLNVITQNEIDYNNFLIVEKNENEKRTLTYKKKSQNNEKAYSVFLRPTTRDITLFGLPNKIFAVPKDKSIIQIKKNEQLFFRYICTEGNLDIVPTGEYNNISRIDEGDYFIQDFERMLEKSFNTQLSFTGKGIEFDTINKDTLVSFHTDENDTVTSQIFNTSQVSLNSISKLMTINNYNTLENRILTPLYLSNTSDIYIRTNKVCFESSEPYSNFNFYTVTDDDNNGFYTITTQSGYYFAFDNIDISNNFYYKAYENSLQSLRIINNKEYLFIAGTIHLFVKGDFGSINIITNRIGSSVYNTTVNGLTYSSITNFINGSIQGSAIQETGRFRFEELTQDISLSVMTTILGDYNDHDFLFNLTTSDTKNILEILSGTTVIQENVFYNKNINTVIIPETVITIESSFPDNPIENILFTTNTLNTTNPFNDSISQDISFVIFDISNNIYYKSSQTRQEILNDISVNLTGSTLAQYSLLEKFGIQKAKLIDIGYTDVSLNLIGINDISYTFINKNLDFTGTTPIIEENEFKNLDISSVNFHSSINTIKQSAFEKNKIVNVDLSNSSITDISNNAFKDNLITSLDLTNCINLTSLGNGSFYNNSIITLDLTTCTNLTKIDDYCFYKCPIETLLLPSSLNYIGKYAFAYNKITSLTIPTSVNTIDEGAFAFGNIEILNISNSVGLENISENAFINNKLQTLNFPYTMKIINNYAFADNDISSISFNSSLKTFNYGSF